MPLSFDPTEDREYTDEQARELWTEARRMAKDGDCDFRGWRFPEDPNTKQTITGGFVGITFTGNANFWEATFSGDAKFWEATFSGDAYFGKVTFEKNVIFNLPPSLPFMQGPFRHHADAAIAYRFVKQAAQDRGNYRMAGKYHFAEQCSTNAHEIKGGIDEGKPIKIGLSLHELIFARLLFGYGERPQRPLAAALFVIFVWALLFWHYGAIEPDSLKNTALGQTTAIASNSPSEPEIKSRPPEECLYFSIVTFTTLGYGDMRPTDNICHRLLAGSEALLGVAIMALFIVSLASKYTR